MIVQEHFEQFLEGYDLPLSKTSQLCS
jgi:hypothetical protein